MGWMAVGASKDPGGAVITPGTSNGKGNPCLCVSAFSLTTVLILQKNLGHSKALEQCLCLYSVCDLSEKIW